MDPLQLLTALLLLMASLTNAEKYEELKYFKPNISAIGSQAAEGTKKFAISVFKHLERRSDDNLIFSPVSLTSSLSMLYMMAEGETAKELATAMHMETLGEEIPEALSDVLNSVGQNRSISLANKAFISDDCPLKDAYIKSIRVYLNSETESIDYNQYEDARNDINSWVDEKSMGKIPELLPSGSLSPDTKIVLVSTVYFNGSWQYPFPEKWTKKRDFTLADGSIKKVDMMKVQKRFGYRVLPSINARVLHIPYEDGEQNFIVILPDKHDGLAELEKSLMEDMSLPDILQPVAFSKVKVYIPKFKLRNNLEVTELIRKAGVTRAFEPSLADFSKATDTRGLSLSFVHHSACIDVNEHGTIASAASGSGLSMRSAFSLISETPEFSADHPFIFFITHSTNAVLFAGKYANPEENSE